MSSQDKINRFIDLFNSNAGGVLTTITNQTIDLKPSSTMSFDFDVISTSLNIPCVVLSVFFNGVSDFQLQILLAREAVAVLADLMMLGDGEAPYAPEDHNDAIKEMFNQVLGSMTAEFAGDGISLNGMVSDVELTDLDLQKEFMQGNTMIEDNYEILGKSFSIYLVMDSTAEMSLDSIYADSSSLSDFNSAQNQPSQSSAKVTQMNSEPVPVSRATFSELEETRSNSSSSKNINIDLLLDVVLPVTVELGRIDMKIKEVLDLGQGSVVELDKLAGDLVELYINGKKFALGEVMVADDNYAVRIVSLVSREERIRSLEK